MPGITSQILKFHTHISKARLLIFCSKAALQLLMRKKWLCTRLSLDPPPA